jgi:hypothetical protein
MDALRPAVALAAALALAGCGDSKEEQRVKELKSICSQAVGATIQELESVYTIPIRIADCGVPENIGGTLGCSAEPPLCRMGFWFAASTDPALCGQNGCYFTCEVRAQLADLQAHFDDRAAVVCATRWVDEQPTPGPFYYAPYWIEATTP